MSLPTRPRLLRGTPARVPRIVPSL